MSTFGRKPGGARLERIKASPRYRDGAFFNSQPVAPGLKQGKVPAITEFLCGGDRRTPEAALPAHDPRPAWARPPGTGLRATWLGHSTVLLEIDGLRVLTDPVWGERASPVSFAGPKRFAPVPVPIAALPPLDAVVISHDHYDHLDHPSILELARLDVPFYTSLGVGAHLEAWGVPAERITELDWWERARLPRGELSLMAAPAQHFSGRGLGGRNPTLWSSFVIESPRHRLFFSGDTGLTPEYQEIRARTGPFDLVMLEVGAYHPSWGDIHLGPENALAALERLGGGTFLPVHWGTFNLALHAWDEPAETLVQLAAQRHVHLVMPELGAAVEPARVEAVAPWWRGVAAKGKEREEPAPEEAPATMPAELPWPLD
jgi:L-ascorbate metabolism protein UlaG (beta-lactamase superfamily)